MTAARLIREVDHDAADMDRAMSDIDGISAIIARMADQTNE